MVCFIAFVMGYHGALWCGGLEFPVGAEMESYGDQAAVAINQFCCKSGEKLSRISCDRRVHVQLARSDLVMFGKFFSR